jgi:hypothetical protein
MVEHASALQREKQFNKITPICARVSLGVSQFEFYHPGKLNSTAVMLRVWQDLAAAAYSSRRSSNAKSLSSGAFRPIPPKIEVVTRDPI